MTSLYSTPVTSGVTTFHFLPGETETKEERELRRREFVIREMIETERAYVSDLAVIVEGYMHEMRSPEVESRIPEDLKDGKDKIVFGNLEAIYEWHRE